MKALILSLILMAGFSAFAADKEESPATEAAIGLNCDSQVPGSTCPAKYSSNVGLLSDTNPRGNEATSTPSSPTDK